MEETCSVLFTDRLSLIPKPVLMEEFGTRQHFLSCFNAVVATEALSRQTGGGALAPPTAFALVKVLLQPLLEGFWYLCC